VLVDGNTWVDLVTWKTIDDAKNAEKGGDSNPVAEKFYSFIDFKSLKHQLFSIEKSY